MTRIFFASRNKAKYPYFRKYCSLVECEFSDPHNLDIWPKFNEDGKTIKENAEIKAINWSKHTKDLVLAEDCGFSIPSLKSWNKVLSKRNLGENSSDEERREKLFDIMKTFNGEDRKVIWTTAIALAKEGKLLESISFDNPNPSYIIRDINSKGKIIEGEFLSCIEFKPRFGKVYSELSEEEIELNEKEMFEVFRIFIKSIVRI